MRSPSEGELALLRREYFERDLRRRVYTTAATVASFVALFAGLVAFFGGLR